MNPEKIIFLDAMDFSGKDGEIRVVNKDALSSPLVLSHGPTNLSFVINYLANELVDTKFLIIGIQPKNCNFGFTFSNDIQLAKDELIGMFSDARIKNKPQYY